MPAFDWLEKAKGLSSGALTVMAQRLPANNDGTLLYPFFFPRQNVDSMDLNEILELDDRPTAARREWDGPEKRILLELPDTKEISMTPLGADDLIGEKELDKIEQGAAGNEQVFQAVIGAKIPARGLRLAEACLNQLEIDCFELWGTGKVTQQDPQSGRTFEIDYQIESGRIQSVITPWTAAANSYNEFIAWLKDAKQAVGGLEGVMASPDVFDDIIADAPTGNDGVRLTGANLVNRIKDDAMIPRFAWFEHNGQLDVDVYENGRRFKRRTNVFPARTLVAVPLGGTVGKAAHAPVRRARHLSNLLPEAKIDIRGVTIFHFGENDDKALKIVSQLNAFPVTNEGKHFSINIGPRS